MRAPLSISLVCFTILLGLCSVPAVAGDVLRVGGTGGATGLLAYLGKTFTAETGIGVEVIPGLGSGGGINAAADGVLDVAVAGRPLNLAERTRGLVAGAVIRTPYVLATSRPVDTSMTERQIIDAYTMDKANWPDGSLIKVILRPRPESDNIALVALFPGMTTALGEARKRPELPIAATDQDNADMAESLPGSLIGATYTQIKMEQRKLRLIAIDGVAPSIDAFESGAYRYTKELYVLHRQTPSAPVQRFIGYIRSKAGISALREAGCLPGGE